MVLGAEWAINEEHARRRLRKLLVDSEPQPVRPEGVELVGSLLFEGAQTRQWEPFRVTRSHRGARPAVLVPE